MLECCDHVPQRIRAPAVSLVRRAGMQPIGKISHRGGPVQLVWLACRELNRLGRRHNSASHRRCRLPPVVMRLGQLRRGFGRRLGLGVLRDSLWRRVRPVLE